jgi:hypothetical protein
MKIVAHHSACKTFKFKLQYIENKHKIKLYLIFKTFFENIQQAKIARASAIDFMKTSCAKWFVNGIKKFVTTTKK